MPDMVKDHYARLGFISSEEEDDVWFLDVRALARRNNEDQSRAGNGHRTPGRGKCTACVGAVAMKGASQLPSVGDNIA
jgi:hypothetical protein